MVLFCSLFPKNQICDVDTFARALTAHHLLTKPTLSLSFYNNYQRHCDQVETQEY